MGFTEVIEDGVTSWEYPLILTSMARQDPTSGEIVTVQGFKSMIPMGPDTKFKPQMVENLLAVEILDEHLKRVYLDSVQKLRLDQSGIVKPEAPKVGASGIIMP